MAKSNGSRTECANVKLFQQGDVLMVVSKVPNDAVAVEARPLAEGEATGHAHRVSGTDWKMLECGQRLFLRILSDDCRVLHEEHGPIAVPVGEYEVRKVREYDYDAEEAKEVHD